MDGDVILSRPLFFVDRWDGTHWTTLYSAPHQISPGDLRGPDGEYPDSVAPGNVTAMAGVPGSKARVRVDDTVVEEFDWALMPVNPLDPNSDWKWGWKSLGRYYESVADRLKEVSGTLTFLG